MAQRFFSCMFPFNFHLKQNSCHRPRAKNRNPFQLLANQQLMFLLYKHREDWLLPGKHGKCLLVSGTSPPKLTVELSFQCYNQLSMIIPFSGSYLAFKALTGFLSWISGTFQEGVRSVDILGIQEGMFYQKREMFSNPSDLKLLKIN